jgi:RHS repeat-associated protein
MAFWVVLINILKIVMKARQMLGLLKGLSSGKLVTSLISDFILGEIGKGLAKAGVPVGSFKYLDHARNSVSLVLAALSEDLEKSGLEIKLDEINQRLRDKIDQFEQGLSVFGGVSPQRNQRRGADPVLFQRGEFERVSADLFVRGAGADLLLRRVYRSGADYLGPLGHGWDHSFNVRLVETDPLIVTQLTGNLSQIRFVQHPRAGQAGFDYYTPEPGTHDILEMDGGGSFRLRKPGGGVVAFEAAGPKQHRIRSIRDCAGNQIDFKYDAENRLRAVFGNGPHRFIRFFYGAFERIERVEDHTGRRCEYSYDETGALVRVEQWSEIRGRPFLTAEAYEYDLVGERPRLARICDERGRVLVENEYDNRTNSDTLGYILNQYSDQGPTAFLYEHLDIKASEFLSPADQPTLRVFETLPNGHVVERVFNEAGNELLRRDDYVDGGRIRTALVRTRYNEDGAIIAQMNGEGGLTQFLFGREQSGHEQWAHVSATLADVTAEERMAFGNQLAKIERGKAMAKFDQAAEQEQWIAALPQSKIRVDPTDAFVKQRFDFKTQVLLSVSDVRATASPDPLHVESAPPGTPSFNPGHALAKAHRRMLTTFDHTPGGLHIRTKHPPRTRPAALGGGLLDGIHEEMTAWDARGRPLSRRDPLGQTTYWDYYPNSAVAAEGAKAGYPRRELRPHIDWRIDGAFPHILEVERIGNWATSPLAIVSAAGSAATLRLLLPCQRIELWRAADGAGPSACDAALVSVDGVGHGLWDQVSAPSYLVGDLSPGPHAVEIHADSGGLCLGRIVGHVAFTFEIDGLGRIVAETNPRGVVTRTFYDRLDRVIERARGTGASMTRERLSYDRDGALEEKALRWADRSGTAIAGGALRTHYQRNLQREVTVEMARATGERDRRITRFYHDPLGSLVAARNGRGTLTRWRLDALGRRVQETRAACTADQSTTTSGYDRCGRPLWSRDGEGGLRVNGVRTAGGFRSGYDARGRLRFKADPLGHLTVTRSDLSGRETVVQIFERKPDGSYDLVERHEYLYDEHGDRVEDVTAILSQPIAAADPVDAPDGAFLDGMAAGAIGLQRTSYELDNVGRQTRVIAGPSVTRIDYDPQGRAFDERLPSGRRVFRLFDGAGNKTRAYAFDAADPSDPTSKAVAFYETYRFDDHDRRVATEDAYGNVWTQSHDTLGNIETMADPLGRRVERRYNAFAQEIERREGLTDGGVPAMPAATVSRYDYCGNLQWTDDPLGRRYLFSYDLLDRPRSLRNASYAADPGTVFGYDRCNRLVRTRDRNGLLRKVRYDKAGRAVRTDYDLSGVAAPHAPPPSSATFVTIDYGARGDIRRLENDWTLIRQARDSRGLLLEEEVELKPAAGAGAQSWRVAQSFDEAGDRTGVVYPSGRAISFVHDAAGRPINVYNSFTPPQYPGSPLTSGGAVLATFRYAGARFISAEYPVADVAVRVSYDGRGQAIDRSMVDRATGALIWRQQTLLDKARQTIVETAMSSGGERSRLLGFDALGRLIGYSDDPAVWIDPGSLAASHNPVAPATPVAQAAIEAMAAGATANKFIFDAVGNRLSSKEGGGPALISAPDADNRYATVGTAAWTHDGEGRLLSDGERQFRYDAEGRIATEQNVAAGQPAIVYFRDSLGRIIKSSTSGSFELYAYLDAQTPLAHWNGAMLSEYAPCGREGNVLHVASGGEDRWLFRDDLYTPRVVLTRGAAPSNELLDYRPFGEPMQSALPAGMYGFAGMLRFPGSSVLQTTHRSYVQPLGRFAQQDPAGFADGLNRYAYAKNNPIDLYDPLGLQSYAPMSKARIDYIANKRGIGIDRIGVNKERAVGRWFQNTLLRSFGLTENGRRFDSLARDLGTNQTQRNRSTVVPDAVVDQEYYKADESSTQFVRGVKYIAWSLTGIGGKTLKDSSFWEFKAYKEGTVINLNDSEVQIKGMIDAASETDATKDKSAPLPSSVHIVTTSGVTVSPDVIAYATSRDVELVLHVAEEYSSTETGEPVGMRVGAGMVLNDIVLMKRGAFIAEQHAGSDVRFEPNQVRINLLPGRFYHRPPQ